MAATMGDEDSYVYKSKKTFPPTDNLISMLLHGISHINDIVGVSYCIIIIEWMLMMEWTGYITANQSNC